MDDKFYAVLDTNVLVSALLGASHMSNPTKVLHAVTDNRIIPLYNNEIIEEYKAVLSRKKFPFNEELIDAVYKLYSQMAYMLTGLLPLTNCFLIQRILSFMKYLCPKKVLSS